MPLHVGQMFHLSEREDFFPGTLNCRKYQSSSSLVEPLAKMNINKNNKKKGCGSFIIFSPQDSSARLFKYCGGAGAVTSVAGQVLKQTLSHRQFSHVSHLCTVFPSHLVCLGFLLPEMHLDRLNQPAIH